MRSLGELEATMRSVRVGCGRYQPRVILCVANRWSVPLIYILVILANVCNVLKTLNYNAWTNLMAKRRKGRGPNRRNKGASSTMIQLPPKINLTPKITHTFRYTLDASINLSTTLTAKDIAFSFGGVATASNTLQSIVSSFKIDRISVWPASVASSDPGLNTTSLTWAPSDGLAQDIVNNDSIPLGVTVTRKDVLRPIKGTDQSFWATGAQSGQGWLSVVCPIGSILDLTCSYTISSSLTNFGTRTTTLTMTTGYYYYPSLDNSGTGIVASTQLNAIF